MKCPVCGKELEEVEVPVYEKFTQFGDQETHYFITLHRCTNRECPRYLVAVIGEE